MTTFIHRNRMSGSISKSKIFFGVGVLSLIVVFGLISNQSRISPSKNPINTTDSSVKTVEVSTDTATITTNTEDLLKTTGPVASSTVIKSGSSVQIGGEKFVLEVVDTFDSMARGLSGRPTLAKNTGMLFVFTEDSRWGVWMKDMKFAIDVIWLDNKGRIVTIIPDMAPKTYPNIFVPEMPARYFLELNAGEAKRLNLRQGDEIKVSVN